MGERRGSKFRSDNPMHREAGEEAEAEVEAEADAEVEKGRKRGKGFIVKLVEGVTKLTDWMREREYAREYAKKPPNPNVKRDQQYEDPTPGPPPELQRKPPASKIEAGGG